MPKIVLDSNFSRFPNAVIRNNIWALLSSCAQAVYPVLLTYMNTITRECYPSNKTISKLSGVHIRLIPKTTKELAEIGIIRKSRSGRKCTYIILSSDELKDKKPTLSQQLKKPRSRREARERKRNPQGQFDPFGMEPNNTHTEYFFNKAPKQSKPKTKKEIENYLQITSQISNERLFQISEICGGIQPAINELIRIGTIDDNQVNHMEVQKK